MKAYEENCKVSKRVVHIIKDGKYLDTVSLRNFNELDIGDAVYNYYGSLLNVISKRDLYKHIKMKENLRQEQKELKKIYYPKGVMDCIKNNRIKYHSISNQYQKNIAKLNEKYKPKLYLRNINEDEMTLGAYMYILIAAFHEKDKEPDCVRNYKEHYEEVREEMKNFVRHLEEGFLERFFIWLDDYCNTDHKKLIEILM